MSPVASLEQNERELAALISRLRTLHGERADDVLALLVLQLGEKPPPTSQRALLVRGLEQRAAVTANVEPLAALAKYFHAHPLPPALVDQVIADLRQWATALRLDAAAATRSTSSLLLGGNSDGSTLRSRVTDPNVLFNVGDSEKSI